MEKGSISISIRAHHLLCMQGFQGYGYDQDFVDNLMEVIEKIKTKPDLIICVINECDDICSLCPHNRSGECKKDPDSDTKMKDMDDDVLKKLGIENRSELKADVIFEFVNDIFNDTNEIRRICGDCDWINECLWFHNREKSR